MLRELEQAQAEHKSLKLDKETMKMTKDQSDTADRSVNDLLRFAQVPNVTTVGVCHPPSCHSLMMVNSWTHSMGTLTG
jgi:hypothetical protein